MLNVFNVYALVHILVCFSCKGLVRGLIPFCII